MRQSITCDRFITDVANLQLKGLKSVTDVMPGVVLCTYLQPLEPVSPFEPQNRTFCWSIKIVLSQVGVSSKFKRQCQMNFRAHEYSV